MCIEYNECHYGGMYNVYVKRIFVITQIVHMNEKTGIGVSSEKEKVKESQSRSVTPSLVTPSGAGLGRHNPLISLRYYECQLHELDTPYNLFEVNI